MAVIDDQIDMLRADLVFEGDPQPLRQAVEVCGVSRIDFNQEVDVAAATTGQSFRRRIDELPVIDFHSL